MSEPLTAKIIEKYKKSREFNFPASVFVAGGINKRRTLERNVDKIARLRRKICSKECTLDYKDNCLANLENLCEYFQNLAIPEKNGNEYRPQAVLDSLLSDIHPPKGNTLSLVTIFNLIAENVSMGDMLAYECASEYFPFSKKIHLSFPLRKIPSTTHRSLMEQKREITNAGLVARIAEKTASDFRNRKRNSKAQRYEEYAYFFEQVDNELLKQSTGRI